MPAKKKPGGNGSWGITYGDVGQALEEHQVQHNCTIEFSVYYYKKFKAASYYTWSVVAHARWRRDTPEEVRGVGSCEVGSGNGAASMPGAYLRALMSACDDLEKRRASPRKAQELARLPGFE
jgi:hypothetical protein